MISVLNATVEIRTCYYSRLCTKSSIGVLDSLNNSHFIVLL